jgi:hypothetical protein
VRITKSATSERRGDLLAFRQEGPEKRIALARRELTVEAREISNLDRGFLHRGAPMRADRHKGVLVGVAGLLPRFLGRHVVGEHFVEARETGGLPRFQDCPAPLPELGRERRKGRRLFELSSAKSSSM